MRLLKFDLSSNSEELDITICDVSAQVPPYAILSHRWGSIDDEVSYQDLTQRRAEAYRKIGYQKIQSCCRHAFQDGFSYAWVDTCCIDKTSSAELSEAINSMYRWYEESQVCYVYLNDAMDKKSMKDSQWFTRGWTLQELIAPKKVRFFNSDWNYIGEKTELTKTLYETTGIPVRVLLNYSVHDVCVSQVMFWASRRQATRIEDRAYSLLGLFNISLPILYGEGLRAFKRLQEEIIRTSIDHSIFAWHLTTADYSGLLAASPDDFARSGKIQKMPFEDYVDRFGFSMILADYKITNRGLEIPLISTKVISHLSLYAVFLACYHMDSGRPVLIYIRQVQSHRLSNSYFRTRKSTHSLGDENCLIDYNKASILMSKILVAEPSKPWARAVRPLLPEEKAMPSKLINEGDIRTYTIRLISSGTILAAFPMPHAIEKSELTIDTDADMKWVASILFEGKHEVKAVFTVVNDELVSSVMLTDDVSNESSMDAFLSCEALYNKHSTSSSRSCKKVVLHSSDQITDSGANLTVKVADPRIGYLKYPRRKLFTLRVDTEVGTQRESLESTGPQMDTINDTEFSKEWLMYVKALADEPSQDWDFLKGYDNIWQQWKAVNALSDDDLGGEPENRPQNIIEYWISKWDYEKLGLSNLDSAGVQRIHNIWVQMGGVDAASLGAYYEAAEQKKREHMMMIEELVESMFTSVLDAKGASKLCKLLKLLVENWRLLGPTADPSYGFGLKAKQTKEQMAKSMWNQTFPNIKHLAPDTVLQIAEQFNILIVQMNEFDEDGIISMVVAKANQSLSSLKAKPKCDHDRCIAEAKKWIAETSS